MSAAFSFSSPVFVEADRGISALLSDIASKARALGLSVESRDFHEPKRDRVRRVVTFPAA